MISELTIEEVSGRDMLLALLAAAWPNTANVSPIHLGWNGRSGALAFLDIFEELSDAGMLSYEALVISEAGPFIYQASITPKGRASLRGR